MIECGRCKKLFDPHGESTLLVQHIVKPSGGLYFFYVCDDCRIETLAWLKGQEIEDSAGE